MINRFKVSGTVKFEVEDIFAENLEDVKQRLQDQGNVLEEMESARCNGNMEVTITEIQDLGLCDIEEFYDKYLRKEV